MVFQLRIRFQLIAIKVLGFRILRNSHSGVVFIAIFTTVFSDTANKDNGNIMKIEGLKSTC